MKRKSFAFEFQAATIMVALGFVCDFAFAADGEKVFATIGNVQISRAEFEREVYQEARQTYYHGKPPAAEEFMEFRRRVADKMIDHELLLTEARRRNLQAEAAKIDARIASYESRYGETERWKTEGPEMIAALRTKFEEDGLVVALEAEVKQAPAPDESTVRSFYDANPNLFTEPERKRVSLILLGVPPSASGPAWAAAREEAQRILDELAEGSSFEELAEMYSSDRSASEGGDMGYLHSGMLAEEAEQTINKLELDEVSGPVQVLEGIAIFKLTERTVERLRAFDDVRERAAELSQRQQGDAAWANLVAELRSKSNITVDSEYLMTLPAYVK